MSGPPLPDAEGLARDTAERYEAWLARLSRCTCELPIPRRRYLGTWACICGRPIEPESFRAETPGSTNGRTDLRGPEPTF